MLIAQISDLHCREANAPAMLGCDNNQNISIAIKRINDLSPRPDLVIATGDLVSAGRPRQYTELSALLSQLKLPLYLIPGNHDEREFLLAEFDGQYGLVNDGSKFVQTVVDDNPLRLVALDTTVPDHHNGAIPTERAMWLDSTLAADPSKPTLILMHHPPFETGIWWMDRMGILEGLDRLSELLSRHKQVIGILAGHVHRAIHSTFAGVPVTICPTTCYGVELDFNDEARSQVTNEPAGFMIHRWAGNALVSYTVFLDSHETYDITPILKDWPARVKRMRNRQPVPKAMGAIE